MIFELNAVPSETEQHINSWGVVFEDVDFGEFGSTVDGVLTMPGSTDKAAWFKDSEGNILSLSKMG